MSGDTEYAVMLRFRDLVTEPGGNVAEHRRIIRQRGYAWWGWWARKMESVPKAIFGQLLGANAKSVSIILFDTGLMKCYRTQATKIVVAPTHLGVNSPDFESTPEYYVRGRYPAWFRLDDDIVPFEASLPKIVATPTLEPDLGPLELGLAGQTADLCFLRDQKPTLWIVSLAK